MKILIVDDIKENLYLVETLLKGSGYEVATAKDGVEAMNKLKEESIDLIISDILMPKMDGFQLCRECKKDPRFKKMPFIFYTATYTDKKDEEFALSLGADKFMVKPQEPEAFLKTLKEVIEEHKKGVLIAAPKEPIKEEEVFFEKYNKRLIHKLEKKMFDLTKANRAIQESEDRFRGLFNYMSSGVVIYEAKDNGKDFIIKNLNRAAEKIEKVKKEDIIGKSVLRVFPGVKDFGLFKVFQEVYKTGKPQHHPISLYKDQRIAGWRENNVYKLSSGEIAAVYDDITERKKATEEIEKLAKFPAQNPNPVLRISKDGIVLFHNYASKPLLKQWHYEEGKPLRDRCLQFVLDALRDDGIKNGEIEIDDKVISLTFAPIVEKGFVNLYGLDITDRRQAEERIKHLNLVLYAIRKVNQLIVKEKNRERLLKGACNNLIKTRGYYHARIVLLDEEGKINTYTEAGLGKDFLPLVKLLKKGEMTPCGRLALKKSDVVIIKDPASACPNCPLVQACSARGSVMTVRLGPDGKIYGVMSVSIPAYFVTDKEEQALFKEITGDIALGLHSIKLGEKLDKQTHDLKERVKELNCLWEISTLIEKSGISLEKIFQEIVNLLPAAWQYPEIACARIILEGKEYKTENFKETIWKQSGDIKIYKKIIGTLEVYYLEERPEIDEGPFQKEEGDLITVIAGRLGEFINGEKSTAQLQQSYQRTKRAMDATLDIISKIVEAKDPYTSGHQRRVSQLATAIAKELNLSQDKVEGIRIVSLIHDIGKIGLPTEILSKPTKLTDIEFSLIKEHPQIGHDILKSIDFSYPVAAIVLQHHERINGSGYPQGLKGEDIPPEAKIICVADVVEAMSSHRPYRPALGVDKALEEISKNKGVLYDPEVVDTCLKLFKEKWFEFK